MNKETWIFGYGSLIWRPDFPFSDQRPAQIPGWARRFFQGSPDHRGTLLAPGRVLTLIPSPNESCSGVAFLLPSEQSTTILDGLDHREKGGYERQSVKIAFDDPQMDDVIGITYIASTQNPHFLGPAPLEQMISHIQRSRGNSGENIEYVLELAKALQALGIVDPHVEMIASQVQKRHQNPFQNPKSIR